MCRPRAAAVGRQSGKAPTRLGGTSAAKRSVVCASLAAGLECCEEPVRCMRADQIDISRCPGAVGLVQTIQGTLLCVPVCVMMADGPMDG